MHKTKKIIIDDAVPYAQEIFSHLGQVTTLPGREIQKHHLLDADALIVRSRTKVNAKLLEETPVKFVGSTVVGLDHVDQTWLAQNDIHFYSAQGCNSNSVAEFVLTALFQLAEERNFDLTQKTLGIIGVGHVGKLVKQKADILGIKTLLNDPPRQRTEKTNTSFSTLEETLQADIITFHTPLTFDGEDKTYHLLSAEHLAKLSPDTIIVNAARGGIIDETAWTNTTTQANIIDCWENEPNINQSLYQTAYLATPHIAGHSLEAKVAGSEMAYLALCDFWQQPPQNQWKAHLPPAPAPIQLKYNEQASLQSILQIIFTQSHNPRQDDEALRANTFEQTQQKFETYRRNYPIYREWSQQKIINPPKRLRHQLQKLGFQLN